MSRNPLTRLPRWAKVVLAVIGAIVVLSIIGAIVGGESSDDAPAAPDGDVATEGTAAASDGGAAEATETPTSTPEPRVATCSDEWDRGGEEFAYRPTDQTLDEATEANCGTLAPITKVCSNDRDNAGVEYAYDPDDTTGDEADAENCGTLAPIAKVCPSDYERGGTEYTFDPDDMSATQAAQQNCGRRYQRGAWRQSSWTDAVDSSITNEAVGLVGRWIGDVDWLADDDPVLWAVCSSESGLAILVNTGGYLAANVRSDVISVDYSFDGSQAVTEGWNESSNNESAFVPRSRRGAFVSLLRSNSEAEFVIRMRQFDGSIYGTAAFDLTGIELQVEPVLQACGW